MRTTIRARLFGLTGFTLFMLVVLGINAYRANLAAGCRAWRRMLSNTP